jgi:hypothetical protein
MPKTKQQTLTEFLKILEKHDPTVAVDCLVPAAYEPLALSVLCRFNEKLTLSQTNTMWFAQQLFWEAFFVRYSADTVQLIENEIESMVSELVYAYIDSIESIRPDPFVSSEDSVTVQEPRVKLNKKAD